MRPISSLYIPARSKRLTDWIETHFSAGQSLVFVHFTSTRFGCISCTRFPWIWCYDLSQFLFTFIAHHFFGRKSINSNRLNDTYVRFNLVWSIILLLFCYYEASSSSNCHEMSKWTVKTNELEWRWCRSFNYIFNRIQSHINTFSYCKYSWISVILSLVQPLARKVTAKRYK